jgi:hypothetical protein
MLPPGKNRIFNVKSTVFDGFNPIEVLFFVLSIKRNLYSQSPKNI